MFVHKQDQKLFLVTNNYKQDGYFFWKLTETMGIVEIKELQVKDLDSWKWYEKESYEFKLKHEPEMSKYKYAYIGEDVDDASLCILAYNIKNLSEIISQYPHIYAIPSFFIIGS